MSGVVSYFIASFKSKREFELAIKKFNLDLKRDNKKYLLQLKIEESTKLYASLRFISNNLQVYTLSIGSKSKNSVELYDTFTQNVLQAEISSNYFPSLKEEIRKSLNKVNVPSGDLMVAEMNGEVTDEDVTGADKKSLEIMREVSKISEKVSLETENIVKDLENL